MGKANIGEVSNEGHSSSECEDSETYSSVSIDQDTELPTCRVCQCTESDKRGDVALGFLGISPSLPETHKSEGEGAPNNNKKVSNGNIRDTAHTKNDRKDSGVVELIGPGGEVFICKNDIEMGSCIDKDMLIELGCSCKNDLALVHYACALKWFINHGSTVCEICACIAKNVRIADFNKILRSLKDYEALRECTISGVPNPVSVQINSDVDPDAVAAIRRQRLSEISLWFNPHINNPSTAVSQVITEQPLTALAEVVVPTENTTTKWAVEGTGILLATGLLTVTLAWLIAPRVGKKTAKNGLHILLGGICALTVVVFFRFFVLTRIKYGPARYWAILFVFWFLVFGIWASRTHGSHTT